MEARREACAVLPGSWTLTAKDTQLPARLQATQARNGSHEAPQSERLQVVI